MNLTKIQYSTIIIFFMRSPYPAHLIFSSRAKESAQDQDYVNVVIDASTQSNPRHWWITPCRLFVTAYSIYS